MSTNTDKKLVKQIIKKLILVSFRMNEANYGFAVRHGIRVIVGSMID